MRKHGVRSKTRQILSKGARERGMPSLGRFMQEFKVGEKVVIKIESSVQKGQPDVRVSGRTGEVVGQKGDAYLVKVKRGNKVKEYISDPVHLRKIGG